MEARRAQERAEVLALVDGQERVLRRVSGVVAIHSGDEVTVRTAETSGLTLGTPCVLLVHQGDEQRRARAEVLSITELTLTLRLIEPLALADRRQYARVDIVLRMLVRRLGRVAEVPTSNRFSIVDMDAEWTTDEVVLSPSGLRGPIPGHWRVSDWLELRIHVPGPRGGEHLVTRAEVVQLFEYEQPPEIAIRFRGVDLETQSRIADIVDRVRLEELLGPPDEL